MFFGKNATAGILSITSADPTEEFYISGKVGYEFVGDEVNTEGVISAPLSDTVGARVAVKYADSKGWFRNDFPGLSAVDATPNTSYPALPRWYTPFQKIPGAFTWDTGSGCRILTLWP